MLNKPQAIRYIKISEQKSIVQQQRQLAVTNNNRFAVEFCDRELQRLTIQGNAILLEAGHLEAAA